MDDNTDRNVHWSLRVVGTVAVLWNVMGCINFISQMDAEALAAMPDWYRVMVETRPAWATLAFAVAVFGGALGGVLLLLEKSAANYVFIASLIGAIAAQWPVFGLEDFPVAPLLGGLMQVAVGVFLVWYTRRAEAEGWVRQG